MATMSEPQHFMKTSGETDAVWVKTEPYSNRPQFAPLTQDVDADVCIVGSGISGISIAYELVTQGVNVVMIEARDIISGETSRTSGHLASALDDGYVAIEKKHGNDGAKAAADSHQWAANRVGEIASQLGIECEYRHLPGYQVSQYPRGDPKHAEEVAELKAEAEKASSLGLKARYEEGYAVKGWDGNIDQVCGSCHSVS